MSSLPRKSAEFRVAMTDLEVTVSDSTVTGTLGHPLTHTISVTNRGPVGATDVILTEEVSSFFSGNSRSISASQGTVKTTPFSDFVVELGDLASGATATIVVTDTMPSSNVSRLRVHANESDTNVSNDTAAVTTTIAMGSSTSSPQVLGLRSIRSRRKGLTAIVVRFDRPMGLARIQDTGIYHLVMVPKGKKARVKVVRLVSATYDAATRSVTLTLRKPVKTGVLRLTIDRAGAVAVDGTALSGGVDWRVAAR